jgi:hypothetical protein
MPSRTVRRLAKSQWDAAMEAARKVFPPDNPYGVFAFGIGERRRKGRPVGGPTLQVLVERKHRSPDASVPAVRFRHLRKTFEVVPDIVATSRRPQPGQAMGHPEFSGLHPGAAIQVHGRWWGAAGYLACDTRADGNSPTHLITAGHLFPPAADKEPVVAGMHGLEPQIIGTLAANLLDWNPSPPLFPMDAAAVELNQAGQAMARACAAVVQLGGLPTENLLGIDAQAFLTTSQDFSPVTRTDNRPFDFPAMQSSARGTYSVRTVLRTTSAITLDGDSGTVLTSYDDRRSAMGLCIGTVGTAMSLFEPAFRACKYLSRLLHLELQLWPQTDS